MFSHELEGGSAAALVLATQKFVANWRAAVTGPLECCIVGADGQPWPYRSAWAGGVPTRNSRRLVARLPSFGVDAVVSRRRRDGSSLSLLNSDVEVAAGFPNPCASSTRVGRPRDGRRLSCCHNTRLRRVLPAALVSSPSRCAPSDEAVYRWIAIQARASGDQTCADQRRGCSCSKSEISFQSAGCRSKRVSRQAAAIGPVPVRPNIATTSTIGVVVAASRLYPRVLQTR